MIFSVPPSTAYEGTLTFASVASATVATQTVTLPTGVQFNGPVGAGGSPAILELPNLQAGLTFCNVTPVTSTTFKITFFNNTGGGLTPTGTAAKLLQF